MESLHQMAYHRLQLKKIRNRSIRELSMKIKLLLLLLCPLFLPGCGPFIQERIAKRKMSHTLDNLMGHTEQEVVIELGAPQEIKEIAGLTVYKYYKSYGTRTAVSTDEMNTFTHGTKKVFESYDKFEVMFKNGRAINWKGSVQR